MAALSVLLYLASNIPVLNVLAVLLAAVPVTYVGIEHGFLGAGLTVLVAAVLVGLVAGPVHAVFFMTLFGVVGWITGTLIHKGVRPVTILFLGTALEGETFLIAAGFAAHRGYLSLPLVWCTALVGSLIGDQVYFLIGRRYGWRFAQRRQAWKPAVTRLNERLARHRNWIVLGFRFFYGLRTVTPFVVGMSDIRYPTFVVLNTFGALVWAVVVGTAGYFFGSLLEVLFEKLQHYELEVIVAIFMAGALTWWAVFFRCRLKRRTADGAREER